MGKEKVMSWGVPVGVFVVCVLLRFGGSMALEKEEDMACFSKLNYTEALEKAILFFEGQRSGKLPLKQRVKWRGDSALSDGKLEHVSLAGGYYDAGDNVKFGWPMSFTGTLLSWAAMEYKKQVASAGQLEHLTSAIRWGADFILKAYTSPTTLYTQVGDGNSDHQCWERPESMDTPRTLYKITSSSPGTEPAADASAALASASIVFRTVDPNYAHRLLSASKSLFKFANEHRGSYQSSCPFYCSSGYQDELLWAAAWLYKATSDSQYLDFVSNNQGWSHEVNEFSWDEKLAGAQALLSKEYFAGKKELAKYKNNADSFVCSLMPHTNTREVPTTPGGLLYIRDAANIQYVACASLVLLYYSKTLQTSHAAGIQCGSVHVSSNQITSFAKSQVDYILGKNPLGFSYMVGFGKQYPLCVHHRGASIPSVGAQPMDCKTGFSTWFETSNPNPNTHVGAIVGGPDPSDHFSDVRSDPNHLEPTTYMNAAFAGALAALLNERGCLMVPVSNSTSRISMI